MDLSLAKARPAARRPVTCALHETGLGHGPDPAAGNLPRGLEASRTLEAGCAAESRLAFFFLRRRSTGADCSSLRSSE